MSRWVREIKIKDLLLEKKDAETIKAAANGLIDRLPEDAPTHRVKKALELADDDPETALLVLNDGLSRIYDWADANGVWMD